jgi:NAD-dependent dihydropyrimidine dehydrogenase PreA subunit
MRPRSARHHHETQHVRLDRRACEACGACVEACPRDVVGMIDIPLHHHAHLRHPERCRGCLACVKACERSAMTAASRRVSPAAAASAAISHTSPRPDAEPLGRLPGARSGRHSTQ